VDGSTPNIICVGTMSADVPLLPMGPSAPGGRVEGGVKNSKNGWWSHSCSGQLPFLFSQRFQMWFNIYGTDLRTFWYKTVKIGQGDSTGWAKKFEKISIHHFDTLRPYISQKRLKIEAYKKRTEKRFIPPLSNCRMCMDPSLTGFYRVGQKLSNVIPVLRITPTATERLPFLFSSAPSIAVAYVGHMQTCAHSGIQREPSRLAKGFPQGGPKS